ncbi:two component transcriptional regulator, LytTR family [Duganella sacchari]|uniref:Two component transcriptional regulator, LytTR family n=1 Tax=Duganella sacchari TaxID=551987 RepID=A0A1M7NVA6_9BURK|nr:response regulator [Duganella sacchari]SHN07994.1 two component transcriptional regulator, LytTR family [Duganella sacchari]
MRILIVDDERPARDKMRRMLAQEPGISAIEEARDGVEALERLSTFAPDVLMLDIQMPEITGFDVAASLPEPAPLVVFVTAYDEYAIRAFDANAIDYLLKPYDQVRLQRAMQRVRERLPQRAVTAAALAEALPAVAQLLVPERNGTRVVKVDDIQWIETADNYVILHTAEGEPLMRQTLAGLLDKLGPRFIRCHRRAAVQLNWIASIVNLEKGDGELLLRGDARVPLSRQYRADVEARLVSLCK